MPFIGAPGLALHVEHVRFGLVFRRSAGQKSVQRPPNSQSP
jgi:hypothetical protein